jgi:opacity protein-like surface antigen
MITGNRLLLLSAFALIAICSVSSYSHAENVALTAFGGIQHNGRLSFQSAPGNTTSFIQEFDPQTFGVYGVRLSHGKLVEGEHSIEYAPNFIDSKSNAFIYHSNLRIQPSISIFKPYATAGVGLVHSGGSSISSFGTKFAFNYGGGATVAVGPIGVNMDVRGYGIPKISISGFSGQQRMDFLEVTAGVVFRFKD